METSEQRLLFDIAKNEETVITSKPVPQQDADEPRMSITINGPERLLTPLLEVLTGVV